ncbi:hypothetical protein HK105_209018 [Polyrhizophydium stewartii]|uniref:Sugar phosphate transporter domain-containing protein n=1 Tax=Polyrhizophydium stewartii TaxID=2732419 RepID=A0ABR4MW39_9FUNG|nr:Triose-phosphate Transporter [Polyrhizophydium stewartii]
MYAQVPRDADADDTGGRVPSAVLPQRPFSVADSAAASGSIGGMDPGAGRALARALGLGRTGGRDGESLLMADDDDGDDDDNDNDKGTAGSGGRTGPHALNFVEAGEVEDSSDPRDGPSRSPTANLLLNGTYAALWFFFSTALSLYNKNLLGKDLFNFNFPLMIVSIHSLCQFALSSALMSMFPASFKPKTQATVSSYLTRVVPTAICTALDISMSNASLHYISLSFYTMIKSSTPVWVLIFAFLFGLERPRWSLISVILVICSGVIFTVAGEIRFSLWGFLLILGASVMSGLRWSLTQILLQSTQLGMDNPVATLKNLTPVGAAMLGLMSLGIEFFGPTGLTESSFFSSWSTGIQTFGVVGAGAILAFCS